jgi:hypothetical protein
MTLLHQKAVEPRVQVVDQPIEAELDEVGLDEVARDLEQLLAPKTGDRAANRVIAVARILVAEAFRIRSWAGMRAAVAQAVTIGVVLAAVLAVVAPEVADRSEEAVPVVLPVEALTAAADGPLLAQRIVAVAAPRTRNVARVLSDSVFTNAFRTPAKSLLQAYGK